MEKNTFKKAEGFNGEWMFILPKTTTEKWREDSYTGRLYVTDAGYFPNAKDHYRERNEGIEENIFIYCLDGSGYIEIKEQKIKLSEKEAFIIPAGTAHVYYADGKNPWSILWMHFAGYDSKAYVNAQKIYKIPEQSEKRITEGFNLLKNMPRSDVTGMLRGRSTGCIAGFILEEVLLAEKETGSASEVVSSKMALVTDFMKKNLKRNLTLGELSDIFKTTETALCATFKRNTGQSPMEYFTGLRMQAACKMLLDSDKRIYEIASELGYEDRYYFTRVFTKIVGESPREYRKRGI